MANEQLKEFMEEGMKVFRSILERDSEPLAQALVKDKKDCLTVIAVDNDYMSDWTKKVQLTIYLVKQLFELGGPLCFTSDAWQSNLPPHIDRKTMPNDMGKWPKEYIKECMICAGNAIGEVGVGCTQSYSRNAAGKPTFHEIVWHDNDDVIQKSTNRFVWDLSERSIDKAIEQVIAFGNGRREVQ